MSWWRRARGQTGVGVKTTYGDAPSPQDNPPPPPPPQPVAPFIGSDMGPGQPFGQLGGLSYGRPDTPMNVPQPTPSPVPVVAAKSGIGFFGAAMMIVVLGIIGIVVFNAVRNSECGVGGTGGALCGTSTSAPVAAAPAAPAAPVVLPGFGRVPAAVYDEQLWISIPAAGRPGSWTDAGNVDLTGSNQTQAEQAIAQAANELPGDCAASGTRCSAKYLLWNGSYFGLQFSGPGSTFQLRLTKVS
jgi:hypothetical protein